MKKLSITLLIASAMLSCNEGEKTNVTTTNDSVSTETTTNAPVMDSAAMAKAWQDYATPGDMHQWLGKLEGTWVGDVKQYGTPDAPPTTTKATDVVKKDPSGLFITNTYTSDMMGMPFEGHGVVGYDNKKQEFVSIWYDNMGSGILKLSGTYNKDTKTLTMKGKQLDPASGMEGDTRQEQIFKDDNTYDMVIYGPGQDGKETKYIEGTFTRK